MQTTIDRAGRVVIPVGVRQRAGFEAGTRLELEYRDGVVTLRKDVPRARLIQRAGRLVAKPQSGTAPKIDPAKWIEAERDRWPL